MKDLIEQQVRAAAQLTGQVGRLEGQMEAVQERLAHHDQVTQRLQSTMDAVAASVTRIEERRKSTMSAAKLVALGGVAAWLLGHLGIWKP